MLAAQTYAAAIGNANVGGEEEEEEEEASSSLVGKLPEGERGATWVVVRSTYAALAGGAGMGMGIRGRMA